MLIARRADAGIALVRFKERLAVWAQMGEITGTLIFILTLKQRGFENTFCRKVLVAQLGADRCSPALRLGRAERMRFCYCLGLNKC